jgi:uncharacterized protein YggE
MKNIRKMLRAAIGALALAAIATAPARAQDAPAVRQNGVRATGEATVTAAPDQAEMSVGVVTEATTADQAAADNARKLDAVLAAVRAALEPGGEVKTIAYSVSPKYVYPRDGNGEPRITGYTAQNTVRVTTGDLKRVGAIIDAATKAGSNNVSNLVFTLKDDTALKTEALRRAAQAARVQATAIADALGLRATGILFAEEAGPTVRPYYPQAEFARMSAANDASTPTPVEAGSIEVKAIVTVTLAVAP